MKVNILGIRELCVENVTVQHLETGIHLFKEDGESVYISNHHISSCYINDDMISVAVKMTKKQFALLESFLKEFGGVSL